MADESDSSCRSTGRDRWESDCSYGWESDDGTYPENTFWTRLLPEGDVFKVLSADLKHHVPRHYLNNNPRAQDHIIDYSGDSATDPAGWTCSGDAPGGIYLTTRPRMWLAVGSGHRCDEGCILHRDVTGDAQAHYEAQAAAVRVMRYVRVCTRPPDEPEVDAIKDHAYRTTGTYRVSKVQFGGPPVPIEEFFTESELINSMTVNPYNCLAVHAYAPHLLLTESGREAARECIRKVPYLAYRLPVELVDAELVQSINNKAMLPPVHYSFWNAWSPNQPIPWTWINTHLGVDQCHQLANDVNRIHQLPTWLQSKRRINKWLHELRTAKKRAGRYRSRQFVMPENLRMDCLTKNQLLDIVRICDPCVLPPSSCSPKGHGIPSEWWDAPLALALVTYVGLEAIPPHLYTTDVIKHFLMVGRYKRVPAKLRTLELDEIAVLHAAYDVAVENYEFTTTKTLAMTCVLFSRNMIYEMVPIPNGIPADHLRDPDVLSLIARHSPESAYTIVPEDAHPQLDGYMLIRNIPAHRRTAKLCAEANISEFPYFPDEHKADRQAEYDWHQKKKNRAQAYRACREYIHLNCVDHESHAYDIQCAESGEW